MQGEALNTALKKDYAKSSTSGDFPHAPWALSPNQVCDKLQVNAALGLPKEEATHRKKKYGFNQLRKHRKKSIWLILYDQFASLIILLLVAAAGLSFIYNEIPEAVAIGVVIFINAGIGFFTELKAVRSMEAIVNLGKVSTRVRRGGSVSKIEAKELVPGDIILFEGGDIVTADMRIIESSKVQVDESALTGESMPVGKTADSIAADAILAERTSMLHKGTAITRGSGTGVVTATGLNTELGAISLMVEEAKQEQTPLEKRLDTLGYRLIGLTLVIAFLVSLIGIAHGKEIYLMVEMGIALAIASIPEGLPVVATLVLAKGVRIMAEKNALINRLSSVETLGATSIIFTDKTGTLTENKMTVTRLLLPQGEISAENFYCANHNTDLGLALETALLCNNATLENHGTGDPLELALLNAGKKAGVDPAMLRAEYPEIKEEAFDPDVKMMATWNKAGDIYRISVKGAPGTVLSHCSHVRLNGEPILMDDTQKDKWLATNRKFAAEGFRMLALAYKQQGTLEDNPYKALTFLGLITLQDPPRSDVNFAIRKCKTAGIRIIMLTGDQTETARYIARSVGLIEHDNAAIIHGRELREKMDLSFPSEENKALFDANIFVRISPQQKLDLIHLYQTKGYIVAMTGDGVNDAPALKKADIGIAMGQRGTQVAREASDMVLMDDSFSTIVTAVKEGRIIFENIRRFIFYLLSCNVSEVLIVAIATVLGTTLPLLPLQILFLNLVTDVFPALALGLSKAVPGIMQQPPREAGEPILTTRHWLHIGGYGLIITAAVLTAFFVALSVLNLDTNAAVTISFLTLAMAQLWHVFNMRSSDSGLINNTVINNTWVWGALSLCVLVILAAVYVPAFATILSIRPPMLSGWCIIVGASLVPLAAGQAWKEIKK